MIFTGRKGNMMKFFFHPCLVATYLGFIIMLTGFKPPDLFSRLIFTIGNCTTPLAMIVVGCILGLTKVKNIFTPLNIYFSFIRLVIFPVLTLGILFILRTDPLITGISVVLNGTPAGLTTVILASKYGADMDLASRIVFSSTLLSIVTVPAWVWLLG